MLLSYITLLLNPLCTFSIICIKDQRCPPTGSLCCLYLYQKKLPKTWLEAKNNNYTEHNTMAQSPTGGRINQDRQLYMPTSALSMEQGGKSLCALFILESECHYMFIVYIKHITCDILPYLFFTPQTQHLIFVSNMLNQNQTVITRSLFPVTVINICGASSWNFWWRLALTVACRVILVSVLLSR